jgi:hypothetical protein
VSAERSTAETRAEVARTVRHLRMPTCAARASYRTRDDEFSLKTKVDEFGQSGFGAVRFPGVGNRRDIDRRTKRVVLAKVCFFFFHANEQNKNVTPNS